MPRKYIDGDGNAIDVGHMLVRLVPNGMFTVREDLLDDDGDPTIVWEEKIIPQPTVDEIKTEWTAFKNEMSQNLSNEDQARQRKMAAIAALRQTDLQGLDPVIVNIINFLI